MESTNNYNVSIKTDGDECTSPYYCNKDCTCKKIFQGFRYFQKQIYLFRTPLCLCVIEKLLMSEELIKDTTNWLNQIDSLINVPICRNALTTYDLTILQENREILNNIIKSYT